MKVTYTGHKIKLYNENGAQVKTIKAGTRDPIALYNEVKLLVQGVKR
jgi:hypothetical protein